MPTPQPAIKTTHPPVAIVTGGTGSIGAAICSRLQSLGMRVVAADRDSRDVPTGQLFFACDVTDPDSLRALMQYAARQGDIRCIVAAHGVLFETPPGGSDPASVSTVIDVNLKGTAYLFDLAKTFMPGPGAIVAMSSWTAVAGRIRNGYAYQATKAGLEMLVRSFAVAYGPFGIRVNCIAPGFMADPMKGAGAELRARQGGMQAVIDSAPLRRLVTPLDIANAVAFLCSHEADAITGIVLPVDAGHRAL